MIAPDDWNCRSEQERRMSEHEHPGRPAPHHGHEASFWAQPDEVEIARGQLAFEPAFHEIDKLPGFDPAPGIRMNVMTGGRMMANWVRIEPGGTVPTHAHEHEQIGLVLDGLINMTIGAETRALTPGWAYTIPGNLPHAATAGPEGCVVLDIFSPPREEYRTAAR
jgi:quercetin dioxygenase-like cupin family protein